MSTDLSTESPAGQDRKLGLGALIALVVGSMVGAGIFALPQNVAAVASPGAALIGWAVSGFGTLMLALVFKTLAERKPELDAGIYAYAKAGFGNTVGFLSAWGYWVAAVVGTAGFFVLLFGALGHFLPVFGEGTTLPALIGGSLLLWGMHFMILRGIREAALVNVVTTVAKIVPLVTFVILGVLGFRADVFTADFWGQGNASLGSTLDQVRGMMLITVWVYFGVEGASLCSARARRRSDVGKATVLGFLGVFALLVLVNVLSMGALRQPELAGLRNPSMAYVLEHLVGHWGAVLILVGLIISVLGAMLAWTLFAAEVLFIAARDRSMPRVLARENAKGVPSVALWVSNGLTQFFLCLNFVSAGSYTSLILLAAATSLLPYFFCAAYALMLPLRGEGYAGETGARRRDFVVGVLATLYAIWLVYAGGSEHLLLSLLLYAPGIAVYAWAQRDHDHLVTGRRGKCLFAGIAFGALIAVHGLLTGALSLA